MQTFSEAKELLTDMYACFRLQSTRTHITLLPKYISNIKAGITEQISAQVGLYSQKLGGVVIAYNNVRLLSSHGNILDDQPYLHFDVQTDYIIFQPTVGSIVKGCVNHIGKGHIGCLVHSCFNGAVPQPWDSGDTWPGYNLDNGQEFLFEIDQIHTQNGILSMRGKLIDSSVLPSPCVSKGKKRKHQSDCVESSSKRQCSSTDVCTDPVYPVDNDECSEAMAPPSAKKKKKKHKHNKDTDLSSDSGIDFQPSPNALLNGSHSKHRKHKKRKASSNDDSVPVKDECFEDNDESFASSAHEHSSLVKCLYPREAGSSSPQSTPRRTSSQTHESGSTAKKHKKSKKIKAEPE